MEDATGVAVWNHDGGFDARGGGIGRSAKRAVGLLGHGAEVDASELVYGDVVGGGFAEGHLDDDVVVEEGDGRGVAVDSEKARSAVAAGARGRREAELRLAGDVHVLGPSWALGYLALDGVSLGGLPDGGVAGVDLHVRSEVHLAEGAEREAASGEHETERSLAAGADGLVAGVPRREEDDETEREEDGDDGDARAEPAEQRAPPLRHLRIAKPARATEGGGHPALVVRGKDTARIRRGRDGRVALRQTAHETGRPAHVTPAAPALVRARHARRALTTRLANGSQTKPRGADDQHRGRCRFEPHANRSSNRAVHQFRRECHVGVRWRVSRGHTRPHPRGALCPGRR